ncbi:hypothetical protein CYLTODRAFT_420836 [Cylindrobasidium torrendii FP15055 ss-10]|uniref:RNase III domain-containing protein n=1 Tax=Cylindrobasidium torrendii FP15055 ss-10 TaxID=1314674 RepID=A0A0D7BGX7_9AGAR|nr:hypothetical protein CYLTODRAFT_420836 [Cylindrobasidium torrendii FP15055 ss-10]
MSRCLRRVTQAVSIQRRNYAQAAVQLTKPSSSASPSAKKYSGPSAPAAAKAKDEAEERYDDNLYTVYQPRTVANRHKTAQGATTPQQEHLNSLFPGLTFSEDLSRRLLTHASHPAAAQGHNAQLTFIGRRVLESYLLLLLSSSPNLDATDDLAAISSHAINTYLLGEHVGRDWQIGRVLRWVPAVSHTTASTGGDLNLLDPKEGRSVGLYKVQGDTVAAVVGGVYREFGASTAHRLFHTRIVPHIINSLPERFREHANEMVTRMGGAKGPLPAPGQ